MTTTGPLNRLFYGDNLEVLGRQASEESVVYLDRPFNSKRDYNLIFHEHDGTEATAQIKAFVDTLEVGSAVRCLVLVRYERGWKPTEAPAALGRLWTTTTCSPTWR